MYSIKDLENRFELSNWQIGQRVDLIADYFDGEVIRKRNSHYRLTESGLAIFEKMLELEKDGHGPFSALKTVQEEIKKKKRDKCIQQLSLSTNQRGTFRKIWNKIF